MELPKIPGWWKWESNRLLLFHHKTFKFQDYQAFAMTIDILRIFFDFGLLVLIWMVQRIIYPSFLHYSTDNLIVWHRKYTLRIGFIVMPLTLGQLGLAIVQVLGERTIYSILSLVVVLMVWLSTFLQFVPIHRNISKGMVNASMLSSLVTKNWLRTLLWTVLFLLSLIHFLFTYTSHLVD